MMIMMITPKASRKSSHQCNAWTLNHIFLMAWFQHLICNPMLWYQLITIIFLLLNSWIYLFIWLYISWSSWFTHFFQCWGEIAEEELSSLKMPTRKNEKRTKLIEPISSNENFFFHCFFYVSHFIPLNIFYFRYFTINYTAIYRPDELKWMFHRK